MRYQKIHRLCVGTVIAAFMVQAHALLPDLTSSDPTPTQMLVGDIAASFDVSPLGAAGYSIPLALPAGIQGMQPKLALSYSSASGEGIMGQGWSLAGLSAITRCPQTFFQDGADKPVSGTSDDRLCLDGQRLMLVSGTSYGADGSTYRTELDSFSKVVAHGDFSSASSWFEVFSKSGRRSEYGKPGAIGSGIWYVSRVEDLSHNYMTFSYYNDNTSNGGTANNQLIPERIQYTKNDASDDSGTVTIDFQYRQLPYKNISGATTSLRRLARITLTGVTNPGEQASDVTRVYELIYANFSGERQRLTSVRVCSSDLMTCASSGTFTWTQLAQGNQNIDFITAFSPVYSARTNVQYKLLSDPSVYVKDLSQVVRPKYLPIGGIILPYYKGFTIGGEYQAVIQPTMYVVSRASVSDGVGGYVDTDYRYTNLRKSYKVVSRCAAKPGRGMSGFEAMESINQVARIRSKSVFAYAFPYVGMTVSQEKRLCLGSGSIAFADACDLLELTQNQFDKKVSGSLVFPYIKTSTVTKYDPPAGVGL